MVEQRSPKPLVACSNRVSPANIVSSRHIDCCFFSTLLLYPISFLYARDFRNIKGLFLKNSPYYIFADE